MKRKLKSLVRFAVESGKIANQTAKTALFEPNRKLELSVFCVFDLDDPEIIEIGKDVVRKHKTAQSLYGWAKFSKSVLKGIGLQIKCDKNLERHANILGWPQDYDVRIEKAKDLRDCVCNTIQFSPKIAVKN